MLVQQAEQPLKREEPAYSLKEEIRPTPDSTARHRYQLITVVRSDSLVEYEVDMGDESNFKASSFFFPAGVVDNQGRINIWHSVGELMDMADQCRTNGFESDKLAPDGPTMNWLEAYDTERINREMDASTASVHGPLFKKER
jgi:hypothetical protein